MRKVLLGVAIALAATSSGCFRSSGNEDAGGEAGAPDGEVDAPTDTMDATVDVSRPECRYVGSAQRCGRDEPAACERCEGDDTFCVDGLCILIQTPEGTEDRCAIRLIGEDAISGWACASGRACLQPASDDLESVVEGGCVPNDVCEAIEADGLEDEWVCRYFDGTGYDLGAPTVDACPPFSGGSSAEHWLCGGACGACQLHEQPVGGQRHACIGVNEARGVGMCAMLGDSSGARCARDWTLEILRPFDFVAGEEREVVCAFLLDADGAEPPRGWIVWRDACELYAALHPGVFSCWRPSE